VWWAWIRKGIWTCAPAKRRRSRSREQGIDYGLYIIHINPIGPARSDVHPSFPATIHLSNGHLWPTVRSPPTHSSRAPLLSSSQSSFLAPERRRSKTLSDGSQGQRRRHRLRADTQRGTAPQAMDLVPDGFCVRLPGAARVLQALAAPHAMDRRLHSHS
jgi:hypothetical protein